MLNNHSDNVYVTSYNQTGGVTANKVIINNIIQSISPTLKATLIKRNILENELYTTEIELDSTLPIPNLYLAAHCKHIIEFSVIPLQANIFIGGHSGYREGYHFTNIPNFCGRYLLRVKTSEPEAITIEYNDQ